MSQKKETNGANPLLFLSIAMSTTMDIPRLAKVARLFILQVTVPMDKVEWIFGNVIGMELLGLTP